VVTVLPDVNVLVALAFPNHMHHGPAQRWFSELSGGPWATCPLTQLGFVRIASNPRLAAGAVLPAQARALLVQATRIGEHRFWPDDVDTLSDLPFSADLLVWHRQITDAYLIAMAARHDGVVVTFDRSMADVLPKQSSLRSRIQVLGV
jgi:toxin-antitoxin system PIN domain toxin